MKNQIDKKSHKGSKDAVFNVHVLSLIDQIIEFMEDHSIEYDEDPGVLEIMQAGLCFRIEYASQELSLSFGLMALRTYKKKKKRKLFIKDMLYLLEKFLMNKVKLVDYVKNEMLLGDILWIEEQGAWSPELYDEKLLARLDKKKKIDTDTYVSKFNIKSEEIKSFIKKLRRILAEI